MKHTPHGTICEVEAGEKERKRESDREREKEKRERKGRRAEKEENREEKRLLVAVICPINIYDSHRIQRRVNE